MAKVTNINDLKPDMRNANKGTQRGRGMVEASLREVGAGRSIVVDKDGRVIAGNKTLEAAADIGLEIQVVHTNGERLVVVQRDDLDLSDDTGPARKLAYLDNRASDVGLAWDAEQLLADLNAGFSFNGIFDTEELDALLTGLVAPEPVNDTPPDVSKASELQKKWSTSSGQIWQLGKHRLAVGDCTDAATVTRLMDGEKAGAVVTDSPYGINREGIINDDPEGLHDLFIGCLSAMPIENAVIINFQSPRLFPVWLDAIREKGHKFERLLWMYDENDQTKPWHYWLMCSQAICVSSIGKPVWSECKAHHDTYVIGLSREWRAGGDANEFAHASVKPVGVIADLIPHTSGIVYEPFCGSGTTLIACQSLSRQCRAIELDSGYAAVTLERFFQATGIEPFLLE